MRASGGTAIAEPVECRLACVRRVIERLPPGNRSVIKRVTAMFKVIQNFSEQNKMTAKNISIVMGPTMFRYVRERAHTHARTHIRYHPGFGVPIDRAIAHSATGARTNRSERS